MLYGVPGRYGGWIHNLVAIFIYFFLQQKQDNKPSSGTAVQCKCVYWSIFEVAKVAVEISGLVLKLLGLE